MFRGSQYSLVFGKTFMTLRLTLLHLICNISRNRCTILFLHGNVATDRGISAKFASKPTKFATYCNCSCGIFVTFFLWICCCMLLAVVPCHWGVMNGGCVVVGRPHPSHPFMESHLIIYEDARATWKKTFQRMRNQCLQDERVDCSSHCMRSFVWDVKVPRGSPKFPTEFPFVDV
jgi:hypothetical protein